MSRTVHTAVIADDEPLARAVVRAYLADRPDIEVVAECADGDAALSAVRTHRPDLLFLDVLMPGRDGFAVLDALAGEERLPAVVFASAFDRFALRAFEASAVDYLLKPFDKARFDKALDRTLRLLNDQRRLRELLHTVHEALELARLELGANGWLQRFLVKGAKRITLVNAPDVHWIEAAGDHVLLHTATDSHIISDTLNDLEQRLDPHHFVRIHRSTIVNVHRIKELIPYANGEYFVVLHGKGARLKLSRSYRDNAKRILGKLP